MRGSIGYGQTINGWHPEFTLSPQQTLLRKSLGQRPMHLRNDRDRLQRSNLK
jgi:hypothetical protein